MRSVQAQRSRFDLSWYLFLRCATAAARFPSRLFGRACLPLILDAPDCICSPGRLLLGGGRTYASYTVRKPSGRFPSGGRLVICFMDGRSGTLGLGGVRAAAVALAEHVAQAGDAIEYGHWRTGHKAPGTTYAAQGVGNKLGVLIGSGVTTLILGASGYDGAAAAQVASALSTIKGVYLYLPLAFAVVIFVIMCFYKLNSKNYNHIVSELEQGRYHPNAKYAPHSEA